MNSNVEAHSKELISISEVVWTNLNAKTPDSGKLFRIRMPYHDSEKKPQEPMFVGFATDSGDIYVFHFAAGGYYPLEVVKEELSKKQLIIFDENEIEYAYLKDGLVKSIPGHHRIVSEMGAILKNERSGAV